MDDALKEAISFGDQETCEELLTSGSAAHVADDEVGSPLHLAASINEGKIVGLLLKYGAKVNYVSPADGNSALHTAATRGCSHAVKVLIRWGADARLKNNQKKTPLELAEKRDKTLLESMKKWVVQYEERKREEAKASAAPAKSTAAATVASASAFSPPPPAAKQPPLRPGQVYAAPTGTYQDLQNLLATMKAQLEEAQYTINAMEAEKLQLAAAHKATVDNLQIEINRQKQFLKQRETDYGRKEATIQSAERSVQQRTKDLQEQLEKLEKDKEDLQRLVSNYEKQNIPVPLISIAELQMTNQVLGTGGFATVYRATFRGNSVAVKKMFTPEECTANSLTEADISDLFYRELRNLCRLRHKNIINVLAACVEPRNLCIVMELCRAGDVRAILSSRRDVSSSNRINWAVGIARGLLFMHASQPQLIHRDLKSANVLIDAKSDAAKLIDFGLCTAKGETDWSFTSHGLNERTTRGTPAYMAPEQWKNEEISDRTDVYAFGVILWEIWTKRIPWQNKQPHAVQAEITIGHRLPIPDAEVPTPIAKLIRQCWLDEPSTRPDMYDVLVELLNFKRLSRGKAPLAPFPKTVPKSVSPTVSHVNSSSPAVVAAVPSASPTIRRTASPLAVVPPEGSSTPSPVPAARPAVPVVPVLPTVIPTIAPQPVVVPVHNRVGLSAVPLPGVASTGSGVVRPTLNSWKAHVNPAAKQLAAMQATALAQQATSISSPPTPPPSTQSVDVATELPFDTFKPDRVGGEGDHNQLNSSNNWGFDEFEESPFETYSAPEPFVENPSEDDLLNGLDEIDQVLDSIPVGAPVN